MYEHVTQKKRGYIEEQSYIGVTFSCLTGINDYKSEVNSDKLTDTYQPQRNYKKNKFWNSLKIIIGIKNFTRKYPLKEKVGEQRNKKFLDTYRKQKAEELSESVISITLSVNGLIIQLNTKIIILKKILTTFNYMLFKGDTLQI